MKLYTRTGDKGQTRIVGNQVVSKGDLRVEAYGTIDELNSLVGVVASRSDIKPEVKEELQLIQQYLFDCGTDTASPHDLAKYRTTSAYTTWLEERTDYYTPLAPELTEFILPGGTETASLVQYTRTVTRRAERLIVRFQNETENNPQVLIFLNRLSDYFFALARYLNHEAGVKEPPYERSGRVFR